jgi:hypothetical protein
LGHCSGRLSCAAVLLPARRRGSLAFKPIDCCKSLCTMPSRRLCSTPRCRCWNTAALSTTSRSCASQCRPRFVTTSQLVCLPDKSVLAIALNPNSTPSPATFSLLFVSSSRTDPDAPRTSPWNKPAVVLVRPLPRQRTHQSAEAWLPCTPHTFTSWGAAVYWVNAVSVCFFHAAL